MRRVVSFLAATALAIVAPSASAQQAPAARTSSLSWVRLPGAEECVATQALARAVEERLGRAVFVSAAQADVSVEGRVEPKPKGPGWHAVITVRDAHGALLGTRELARDDKSCDAMREPLALVIAVMIDPDAVSAARHAREDPPPPAPVVPPEAPALPPTVIVQERQIYVPGPAKPHPLPWRFEASAALIGTVGLVPGLPVGGYIGWILEPPKFIGLEGYAVLFPFGARATDAGASVGFALAYVGGSLCPLKFHGDGVHLYGCLGSQIGVLRSDGSALAIPAAATYRLVLNESVEARMSVRLFGPLAFRAGLGLVVPILRDHFVYTRSDGTQAELFRMSVIASTLDLGIGVIFP